MLHFWQICVRKVTKNHAHGAHNCNMLLVAYMAFLKTRYMQVRVYFIFAHGAHNWNVFVVAYMDFFSVLMHTTLSFSPAPCPRNHFGVLITSRLISYVYQSQNRTSRRSLSILYLVVLTTLPLSLSPFPYTCKWWYTCPCLGNCSGSGSRAFPWHLLGYWMLSIHFPRAKECPWLFFFHNLGRRQNVGICVLGVVWIKKNIGIIQSLGICSSDTDIIGIIAGQEKCEQGRGETISGSSYDKIYNQS